MSPDTLPGERVLTVEIKELVIPFEVEQKLIWKHGIQGYEVE